MKNRIFLGVLTLFVFFPSFNYAQAQNCDALVVDEAGVLAGEISEVTEAAKRVQNLGAEVRIRIFSRGTNLDFDQDEFESRCQSWRAPDGGTRNNLVSMLMAVEDVQFGFYVGSQWGNVLSRERQNQIENDYLFPRFREGDFAGAFVAGLGQVEKVIDAKVNGSIVSGASAPVVIQTEPTDFTGLWLVMFSVVIVGLVVGAYVAYGRKKKENERRRAAQQKALIAKREVSAKINGVSDSLPGLVSRIAALSGLLSQKEVSALKEEVAKVENAVGAVSESFAKIGMGRTDAEQTNLTAQEYANIETEYRKLDASMISTSELENKISHLSRLAKELSGRLEEVKVLLEGVSTQILEVEKTGFKVDGAKALFAEASTLKAQAKEAFNNKNLMDSEKLAREVEVKADEALSEAKSMPQKRAVILKDVETIRTHIGEVNNLISQGHVAFKRISEEFAESCWESVKGNGVEAEERLAWAEESVDEVVSLASMENQKWDEAQDLVKEVGLRLTEAASLMRSIIALEENIQAAKRDAQQEIKNAHSDIRKAWDYIEAHDDDISEDRKKELKAAEEVLHSVVMEGEKNKPDYLRIVKLAQEANSTADKILENARSEHETMERLRQKAATSVRDARAVYSKAKEYIEDHRGDVGATAKSDLAEASTHLPTLDQPLNLNKKIELANKIEQLADSAYKKAKKNVDDEEEERARKRKAAVATRASYSSSSSYRSSSPSSRSSGSFGGSRSWGSSGSIGGSRSLGSSSRIGGSRKW